jgi:hypothetical protein
VAKKRRINRAMLPLDLGGMHRAGDASKMPGSRVYMAKNVFFRGGAYEQRGGWQKDDDQLAGADAEALVTFSNGDEFELGAIGSALSGFRDSLGAWTDYSAGGTMLGFNDVVQFDEKLYGLSYSDSSVPGAGHNWSYDGSSAEYLPFGTHLWGASIEAAIRRLFIGGPKVAVTNLLGPTKSFDITAWALNATVQAVSGTTRVVTFANSGSYAKSGAFVAPSDGHVNWQCYIEARDTQEVPLTLKITDGGSKVYKSLEVLIPLGSSGEGFIRYSVTGYVPPGTSYELQITPGTSSRPAGLNMVFGFSDVTGNPDTERGQLLTHGRFNFDSCPLGAAAVIEEHPDWVIWCETDEINHWRAINFEKLIEYPGEITLVRGGQGVVAVYKRNAVWLFGVTDIPDQPLIRQGFTVGIGCRGPRAFAKWEQRHFFIGDNQVWAWGLSGQAEPLVDPGMRDYLFAPATMVANPILEIDPDKRELWVHIQQNKLHVFHFDSGAWTEFDMLDSTSSPLNISDLLYTVASGETQPYMWAIESSGMSIVRLDPSATLDRVGAFGGVPITVEIIPRPIEFPSPRPLLGLEKFEFDHEITDIPADHVLNIATSTDGGATWSENKSSKITPAVPVGGDTRPLQISYRTGGRKIFARIQYSGLAGASRFNLNAIWVQVVARGRDVQAINPTPVSDTGV